MHTKVETGYVSSPTTQYLCNECIFVKEKDTRCAWLGPQTPISGPTGGCNVFKAGPSLDLPYFAPYSTKDQLGYLENKQGFGCRRCVHFSVPKHDCTEVEKDSPGDTPGEIAPLSCCDFWSPDKKRAKMTNKELVKLVSAQDIKKMDFEAYEKQRGAE